jgi:hypothetical protein
MTILVSTILVALMDVANAQDRISKEAAAGAEPPSTSAVLEKIAELVDQNSQLIDQTRRLEKRNEELVDQIQILRRSIVLTTDSGRRSGDTESATIRSIALTSDSGQGADDTELATSLSAASASLHEAPAATAQSPPLPEARKTWGTYTPNFGFKVADTEHGDMSVSAFTYARYLNQLALNSRYTNAFGVTIPVQNRQDFQLQKVQIKFLGWILDRKLRYFLYTWTSNVAQGLGAQVVVAGNVNYAFNKYVTFSAGVNGLPGTRSIEGNFPYWLSVDSRLIADEFFRPSYTSGIWARGKLTNTLAYMTMLGNNLSTLGVNAAQLNGCICTSSTALVWAPTTGEFGGGFGDFENHQRVATRFGAHFTRSYETRQNQPNSDQFENTQIRLSDGTIVFTPDIFGPGIIVNNLDYHLAAFDGGLKYHGFSIWSEGYYHWLNNFGGPGTAGLNKVTDTGYQIQASSMLVPETFQAYLGTSKVFGKYGEPWDARIGLNWFPYKNRVVRWNAEGLYLSKSPVGNTSLPYNVGSRGFVFYTNWEVAF